MRDPSPLSSWVHFLIHSRRADRNCIIKFFPRHCSPRHLLCSSTLPLCPVHGGRICYHGCICSLIPPILRVHPAQHLNKNPLWSDVRRGKSYFLPTALPRPGRNAPTVFRLPRRLHPLKYGILNRDPNLPRSRHYVLIYSLRSICRQTRSCISRTRHNKRGVTTRLPSSIPHFRRARLCTSTSKITRKGGIEPP